jgi:S1-C subfamily serine protease
MEFVDPEDEPQQFRRPPPPDDRVWRHPSEMGPVRPAARRQLWMVGLTAAVAASLISTGLAVIAGSLLDGGRGGAGGVDRSGVLSLGLAGSGSAPDVPEIAERVRPAITQLRVEAGRSTSGSGVIFRSDGQVLTNAHVVEGATAITVVLATGSEVPGKVVGSDADTDTAVVKIDGGPYPVAELGTASDLKVGQTAVAIGSPLARTGGPSVTVGVISALHRSVRTGTGATVLMDMVQTDAPIAPSSSGGALVDGAGRVVGITTAVAGADGATDSFGFATPIDVARAAAEQLMATGKVVPVWLGVEGSDLDGPTASTLQLEGGALVDTVRTDSPAERAGLAAKDVIVGVDGRPVMSLGMLAVAVRAHRPGDIVTLDVVRDRQHHGMTVTVAERPPGS